MKSRKLMVRVQVHNWWHARKHRTHHFQKTLVLFSIESTGFGVTKCKQSLSEHRVGTKLWQYWNVCLVRRQRLSKKNDHFRLENRSIFDWKWTIYTYKLIVYLPACQRAVFWKHASSLSESRTRESTWKHASSLSGSRTRESTWQHASSLSESRTRESTWKHASSLSENPLEITLIYSPLH